VADHAVGVTRSPAVEIRDQERGAGETCRAILATIPAWFGIEESNRGYIARAEHGPSVIASIDGSDIGITVVTRHFPEAAEVHLMAVHAAHHRHGAGRRMLEHAEAALATEGVRFLQVKTLSPRSIDAGYERTRAFYRACGFSPLEEFPDLWDADNPALQMIKTLR